MPEAIKMEDVCSAMEEAARLLDVDCSRDKVWPVLSVYGNELAEGALVVFSMAAGERHGGELDYNFTVPSGSGDPYTLALENGLIEKTDHPVGTLLSDIAEQCPISVYGVECGVGGGFKKVYAFFPLDDLQSLSKLAAIPSMPRSLAEHADTLARYGLDDRVSIIGIDYVRKTMNVYFGKLPAGCLEPETVRAMHREIELPEPSEQMLEFIQGAFSIYPTFSWDSSRIERICFSVVTQDQEALPARLEPEISNFARNAPHAYAGERTLVYGATLSPREEYYKLGVYYQKPPELWSKTELGNKFDNIADGA